jgi:capsular exopolysaccharide synthesis family protein
MSATTSRGFFMQHDQEQPQAFPLRESISLLRRRRRSIVSVMLLVVGLVVGYVALRPATYRSTALVEVRPLTSDEELQPFAADSFVNMDTEAARVTQDPVMKTAAATLGKGPGSASDLQGLIQKLEVTTKTNTTFLEMSCTDATPAGARACAAAVANAYIDDRVQTAEDLYQRQVDAESAKIEQANEQIHALSEELDQLGEGQDAVGTALQARIDAQSQLIVAAQTSMLSLPTASPDAALLAQSADLPAAPANKDFMTVALLAGMLGLALGVVRALMRDRLAEPVADLDHFESVLLAPVIAVVPQTGRGRRMRRPVTVAAPESRASQAYKTARTALLQFDAQVIAVTSPGPGEGKTASTANLAVALAQGGKRVVAVSCDLRQPQLHRLFDRGNDIGLTDGLVGDRSMQDAIIDTDLPGLAIIPSGPSVANSSELLGGDAMRRTLDELRLRYDFVLLDTPPALVVADTISLVPFTDGVIVVADETRTPRSTVSHLRRQFGRVGAQILGGILYVQARQADRSYSSYVWSEAEHGLGDRPGDAEVGVLRKVPTVRHD